MFSVMKKNILFRRQGTTPPMLEDNVAPSMDSHQHPASASDEFLLQQICSGCADCFAVLFHRYCRSAFSVAHKILRDRQEAEDILQEVFLAIYLQQEKYDASRASVRTWILQFAYFKALLRRRYLRIRNFYHQEELQETQEFGIADPEFPLFGLNQGECSRFVERGLAVLTPQQRRAIELVNVEGLTLLETSQVLRESLANTRNYYYRGMKALRSFFSEHSHAKTVQERAALEKHALFRWQS
jgi:RNA polymerase sigma-70 factor (ECF subfamily)